MKNLLERACGQTLSLEVRKDKVLGLLRDEGKRLSSTVLISLAMKVQADPFVKVDKLIQQLIERLITESTAEATKKGFCDLELRNQISRLILYIFGVTKHVYRCRKRSQTIAIVVLVWSMLRLC